MTAFKTLFATVLLFLTLSVTGNAANTKTSVEQVTTAVSIDGNTDYVVTGATPFDGEGLVNIVNKEHAVLILEKVKPSVAIASLLTNRIQINGAKARNNVNCQVRLYGTMGCMVLPYANTDKPLTVYSGQNFTGDECSDFGLENDGGYMVTLSDKKLNNRIRSFRLKRGYMVTFATRKSGWGYQRCFIANDADVEMATLPQILDEKISSYRIFKWNTAGKKALASSTNATACDALNVISCYDWGVGHDMGPDVECVANHLYEDYPSSSACGQATWTCHMKTNNEPRNSSDDKPQSLNTILDNWQNLMRTGMRLCSPSSWDGSDYTDGSGFLKQFFDSIDARGWRCDLADLHCYWLVDNFKNIGTMQSKYKRPIWISEWIWGASWNKNGAFESGKTDWDNEWAVKTICGMLNGYDYVERYFYWNSESKGKIYDNGLTVAGKTYASMLTGMGYKSKYEKIPTTPRMRGGFRDFRVSQTDGKATVTWHDYDGEYNQLMEVLRKEPGGAWQVWKTVRPEDDESDYALTDDNSPEGTRYRLHIRSFSGRDYYSSEDMEPGEAIILADGTTKYVGGNLALNGDFQMGLDGWTSGSGEPLAQPWFEVLPKGLTDGYFLQAFANKGKDDAGSLKTAFEIVPKQDYVLRMACCNAGEYLKLDARKKGEAADENKATLKSNSYWSTQQAVFNSGDNNEALLSLRWLAGTAQISDIELRRLFDSREDALLDGEALKQQRDQALKPYLEAMEQKLVDSLMTVAKTVADMGFDGREELQEAMKQPDSRWLKAALDSFLVMQPSEIQPQSPSFDATDGWQTKAGSYTGGDQRTATQEGKTCWNAWWSGIGAAEGEKQSMEIRQQLAGLPCGLYSLECKATTQHYCLSDQHGFLTTPTETVVTPLLTRDYLDVPNTVNSWQTLTTTPVYVAEDDTITIGFTGSKKGAVDFAWRRYGNSDTDNNSGDQREGWWCATDFRLLFHPLYKFNVVPGQWSTICLPYAYPVPENVELYQIAGLLSDYSCIAIEKVDEVQPGLPYICLPQTQETVYYTAGEAVKTAGRNSNNLRGYFKNILQAPVGVYVLRSDGEWYRTTERETPASYSAIISRANGMTILDTWDGLIMPIHDVDKELGDPSLDVKTAKAGRKTTGSYDLNGRPANVGRQQPKGLVIQTDGNKAKKVVVR
jgi:hypothetical protein